MSTLTDQMAADLREQIRSGALKPNDTLPSESTLGDQYGVSRVTVRRALERLQQEGLIASQSGRGRIVREQRPMVYRPQQENEPRISSTMDRFMSFLSNEGRKPSQSIEVSIEEADILIAKRFGVEVGTPVVARKRVRSIDGEPFNINDTYYLHEVVKDTPVMSPADIPRGSNRIVEDILGDEVRAIDEFYIRMPTPEEAQRLQLSQGTPVAVHYVTGYTAEDKIVRVDVFVLPGDRHVIVYERVHPTGEDE
jgi:DNA-binding GntR family transcriptional regulator